MAALEPVSLRSPVSQRYIHPFDELSVIRDPSDPSANHLVHPPRYVCVELTLDLRDRGVAAWLHCGQPTLRGQRPPRSIPEALCPAHAGPGGRSVIPNARTSSSLTSTELHAGGNLPQPIQLSAALFVPQAATAEWVLPCATVVSVAIDAETTVLIRGYAHVTSSRATPIICLDSPAAALGGTLICWRQLFTPNLPPAMTLPNTLPLPRPLPSLPYRIPLVFVNLGEPTDLLDLFMPPLRGT